MPAHDANAAVRTPREIRAWIVDELAALTECDAASIDTSAPLQSLGVDSLVAFTLTGELATWLGRDLPATLVWDYPTIDAIADDLGEGDASPSAPVKTELPPGVMAMRSTGSRTPLFFLPGVGGHPVSFIPLADHLGDDQPCYGLASPGVDPATEPPETIEQIAEVMIERMRRIQPEGPYRLMGYSFGGLVAYEMARQLDTAGQRVDPLVIIDTFTPQGRTSRSPLEKLVLHVYILFARPQRVVYLWRKYVRGVKSDTLELDEQLDPGAVPRARVKSVIRANRAAAGAYVPGPYAGSVVVLRATERAWHDVFFKSDPTNGWAAVAEGGATVIDLPGHHRDIIAEPNIEHVVAALRPHLDT